MDTTPSKPKRHQAKKHKRPAKNAPTDTSKRRRTELPIANRWTARPPQAPTAAAVVVPVSAVSSVDTSSSVLPLLLACALALALLVLALALTPPWVLPRHLGGLAYEHRDTVALAAAATAVSIGLGLMVALLGS